MRKRKQVFDFNLFGERAASGGPTARIGRALNLPGETALWNELLYGATSQFHHRRSRLRTLLDVIGKVAGHQLPINWSEARCGRR